jgi:hypothetical protein
VVVAVVVLLVVAVVAVAVVLLLVVVMVVMVADRGAGQDHGHILYVTKPPRKGGFVQINGGNMPLR